MIAATCSRGFTTFLLAVLAAVLNACGVVPSGECFRAIRCVQTCGGIVVASGCAACPASTFDDIVCATDAGSRDASLSDTRADSLRSSDVTTGDTRDVESDVTLTDAADVVPVDAAPFSCGSQTCGATQICVQPCSGVDSGRPVLPRCIDAPASCGATPSCGCLTPGICPPSNPPFAGCRQDSARHFTCSGCA